MCLRWGRLFAVLLITEGCRIYQTISILCSNFGAYEILTRFNFNIFQNQLIFI